MPSWSFIARRAALAVTGSVLSVTAAPAMAADDALETVIVTAQKRSENLQDVPLSVSVVLGADLTETHTADYEDLTRSVPGVSFSSLGGAGLDRVEMRGISSDAGSPTVSMYMNDVPITMPNLVNTGASQPRFFDLDHVELLRGPQGTLYGSSSMGGSIKFVTHEPNLDRYSVDLYADGSGMRSGGMNYESNFVVNLPLVDGKAALRVGFDVDHESGYINNLSLAGATQKTGTNTQDSQTGRLVLKLQPTDDLAIIPEVNLQRTTIGDTSVFYLCADQGTNPAGTPCQPLPELQQQKLVRESGHDDLVIPSLTLRDDLHWADLTGVSSYFWRHYPRTQDGTNYNSVLLAGELSGDSTLAQQFPNVNPTAIGLIPSAAYITPLFRQYSEELRLTSKSMQETGLPFSWIGGLFFSDFKLHLSDQEYMTGLSPALAALYGQPAKVTLAQVLSDSGLSNPAYNNFLLSSLDEVYMQNYTQDQKQYAIFGEFTYQILEKLKMTIGIRILHASDNIAGIGGSYYNADATPIYSGATSYNGYTPKFSLSYDLNGMGSAYVSATKGVRLGGFNEPIPQFACQTDFANLGISKTPANYQADSLWSYEAGNKISLFGNRVSVDAAGYYIVWQNVQQDISLPTCGYDFFANAGNAESYGAEAEIRAKLTDGLTLSLSGSDTVATLTAVSPGIGATVGQSLIGVPDWTAHLGLDYNLPLEGDDFAFARTDYSITGPSHGQFNQSNPDYDRPSYGVLNASVGLNWHGVQWQLYGKNLTNDQKIIQRPALLSVSEGYTLRPMTLGLALSTSF